MKELVRFGAGAAFWGGTADKARTPVTVRLGDEATPVAVAPGTPDAQISTPSLADAPVNGSRPAGGVTVPLRRLAYGRSGDKGDREGMG